MSLLKITCDEYLNKYFPASIGSERSAARRAFYLGVFETIRLQHSLQDLSDEKLHTVMNEFFKDSQVSLL